MRRGDSKGGAGDLIKDDLCSRPNALMGRYKIAKLGLDDLTQIKSNDIFFLESLKMKADLADKLLAKAEAQGQDLDDQIILKKLGEEINSLGTPVHQGESIMTALFVSLRLVAYYGIALGIWGLAFKKSFLALVLCGIIAGFVISFLSVGPVIAFQRTREKIRDVVSGAGFMWGNLALIVGGLGLISLIIRLVFFD